MSSYHAATPCIQPTNDTSPTSAFARSEALFRGLVGRCGSLEALQMDHGELERMLDSAGREVTLMLLQDHLDLRAVREVEEPLVGSDGVELRSFFSSLQTDPDYLEMLRFWQDVDVCFLSVVKPQWRYQDVHERLRALGLSTQELINRGATAVVANRFLDDKGRDVPLAEGVPSYEVAMPTDAIRASAERHGTTGGRRGFVVLDVWGEAGGSKRPLIQTGLANVLICDAQMASVTAEQ